MTASSRSVASGYQRTGPPASTSERWPESLMANARTRCSRFFRGSMPPTNNTYGPGMPNRRRTASTAASGTGANASASTPWCTTWTRAPATPNDSRRSCAAEPDGTMMAGASASVAANRRRQRSSMCGADSGKCWNARSCTTGTTRSR